jgi:uncharacterized protein YndB with AHSA1/START domain/DNA-binding transcriptional ArsR family regulator
MDAVFKALADPHRRRLLDRLKRRNGQTLHELCEGLAMSRQAVAKHLAVLEAAHLVTTRRHGREKLHFLNAAPINEISERWIRTYDRERVAALADLKQALEEHTVQQRQHAFVYETYILTTPETLWKALTEPKFTRRYWGAALKSDWKVGSPVLWQEGSDPEFHNWDQVVLESDPPRRLSYSWHSYREMHKEMFGWSDEQFAELITEPRSKVTFEIEPFGEFVKLTVIHDDFDRESVMLQSISGGWPMILSGLKTYLETGKAPIPEEVAG